ncbi:hypothetical protein R1sor_016987 [Riccia sorocarpa]|uniref:Uncharacterized protein n=1 Tax=Riccia sorocarpa TaxID=122646 RepID=A0ABD3I933_9MARC
MDARESAFNSTVGRDGETSQRREFAFLESEPVDEFSQRPDFSSQAPFFGMSSPLLSVPSSQVHPQLAPRVVRPRVTAIDPGHIAAWARRASTQPLPISPPDRVDVGTRIPGFNLGAFVGPNYGTQPIIPPVNMVASMPSAGNLQSAVEEEIVAPGANVNNPVIGSLPSCLLTLKNTG